LDECECLGDGELGLHDFAVGAKEGLGVGVAALVGYAEEEVGVVVEEVCGLGMDVGGLCEEGESVLDAEGVDVVGEGLTMDAVDGVDDLVLRDMEGFGEGKDREVGVAVALLLDVEGELTAEGCEVARALGAGAAVDVVAETLGAIGEAVGGETEGGGGEGLKDGERQEER
jgi:hypothetical protein